MKDDTEYPRTGEGCYIHPQALLIGDIITGRDCSFWPFSIARGDEDSIRIGDGSNLQDCAVIHVDIDRPVSIGDRVSIGHSAVVHGCTVEDNCIIGIGSVVLDGARIGRGSIIGAGAVVTPGTEIPPNSMVLGAPGRVRKKDPKIEDMAIRNSEIYIELGKKHSKGLFGSKPLKR